MRTNLNVPFGDRNKVKELGAQWDIARKVWHIENVENIKLILPWIEDKLKQPTKSKPLIHPKFKKNKTKKK